MVGGAPIDLFCCVADVQPASNSMLLTLMPSLRAT